MECVICKNGKTVKGKVNVTLERDGLIIVMKGISALVCNNCEEYYLDDKTTGKVLKKANDRIMKVEKLK